MKVDVLNVPKGFGARLPFGPPKLEQAIQAIEAVDIARNSNGRCCDIDEEAKKLITVIEQHLVMVAGIDGKKVDQHTGRAEGPQVIKKCPIALSKG